MFFLHARLAETDFLGCIIIKPSTSQHMAKFCTLCTKKNIDARHRPSHQQSCSQLCGTGDKLIYSSDSTNHRPWLPQLVAFCLHLVRANSWPFQIWSFSQPLWHWAGGRTALAHTTRHVGNFTHSLGSFVSSSTLSWPLARNTCPSPSVTSTCLPRL